MCLNLVKIILIINIMNNGPNLVSLCIIGGVAGASMFGLYLGYKALFDKYNDEEDSDKKGKLKKNLSELLSVLPSSGFDAAKTLENHKNNINVKGERTKLRNPSVSKSSEDKLSKNREAALKDEKFVEKATSIIDKADKKIGIVEVDTKADMIENVPEKPLAPSKSMSNIIKKNDELPLVMNKKRLSESNEEIETLLELPGLDNNAAHANLLIDNETIRTIDKANLKKKKRNKKHRSKKKESAKKD